MKSFGLFDWGCLAFQFACLLGMIVKELRKPQGKNLLMVLVCTTIIGLVQIQTVWTFLAFDGVFARVQHLNQAISLEGARSANILVTLFVICFCSVAYRMDRTHSIVKSVAPASGPFETNLTYGITVVWVLGAGALLTALAGGVRSAFENPGQAVAGQTLLLILVSIGKIPLVRKLALRRPIAVLDVVLYLVTFLLLLLNSRFLAAYAILQVAIVFHYRRKEASTALIVGLGAALMAIFVVFGLYREASFSRTYVSGFSTTQFISENFTTGDAFDWFYSKNVEGFVGLAGIMTYESDLGYLDHDYGVSNLQLLTALLPNSIRTDPDLPFNAFTEEVRRAYPYTGSVIPSGLEASYAHFGVLGVLGLGLILGYLIMRIHRTLIEATDSSIIASLLSVHVLSLVREMLSTATFFGLGEIFIVGCYRRVLKFTTERAAAPLDAESGGWSTAGGR